MATLEGEVTDLKRHRPGEIGAKLRQVAVLVGQGQTRADAAGVTERTCTRRRTACGGMVAWPKCRSGSGGTG